MTGSIGLVDVPPVGGNDAKWFILSHNAGVILNLDMVWRERRVAKVAFG